MMESSKAMAQRAAKQRSSVNMEGIHMPHCFSSDLKNPQGKTMHGAVMPDSRHTTWQSVLHHRLQILRDICQAKSSSWSGSPVYMP